MASSEHTTQVQGLTFTFVPADVNGASSSVILSLDEANHDTPATVEQPQSPDHGTATPTSPTSPLAATFEDNYASALHIVTKSRSRRQDAKGKVIAELQQPSLLVEDPHPELIAQPTYHPFPSPSRPAPTPPTRLVPPESERSLSPVEQISPRDGLTVTIPIPSATLRGRPKHRYVSPTRSTFSPLPSSPTAAATDTNQQDGEPQLVAAEVDQTGTSLRVRSPAIKPRTSSDTVRPAPFAPKDRFTRTKERRRRARELFVQGAAPFPAGAGRSTSRTLVFPFVTPPQPPSSSGASFGNVIPPALSNSLDLIIVVHQPTPLYPGDLFSFILQLGVPETPPTSPTPSTLSLSFSAHVLRHDPTPADDKAYAHHTLFTQTSTIPLPSHLGSTPLSLPFTTSVPLQAECETCSARYETMPPSLRVETPQHLLQARASYKLVAIWGEKAAVAEVQVEQREAVVGGMVSRGGWVKLEGEKDMRGSWKGWELIKMETAYHLSTAFSPATDLLLRLDATFHLSPSSLDDPQPLLDLLPRLNADHSHLILYEILFGPERPMLVSRAWSSSVAQHDLEVEVETFGVDGEKGTRGVRVRRGFRLREVPISSFKPFAVCAGYRMEYRFELVLGKLNATDDRVQDHLRFSMPFLSRTCTVDDAGVEVYGEREVPTLLQRARRWVAKGGARLWSWVRCRG